MIPWDNERMRKIHADIADYAEKSWPRMVRKGKCFNHRADEKAQRTQR